MPGKIVATWNVKVVMRDRDEGVSRANQPLPDVEIAVPTNAELEEIVGRGIEGSIAGVDVNATAERTDI